MPSATPLATPSARHDGPAMSDSNHATPHILVIEARFYEDIADALYEGASTALDAAGVTHERVAVPGVFEVPAVIRMAVRSRSEEHKSEIQSLMRSSYADFC